MYVHLNFVVGEVW